MDIKAQISKLTDAVTKDPALLEQFQKEPIKVVEKVCSNNECLDIFMEFYESEYVRNMESYQPVEFFVS